MNRLRAFVVHGLTKLMRIGWRLAYSLPGGDRLVSFVAARLANVAVRVPSGRGEGFRVRTGGGNPAYLLGAAEPAVQDVLSRVLQEGDVLYDIGANVGFFSLIGARVVGPAGRVYAFEPVPANAAVLRENIERNGVSDLVEVFECAVGEANRTGFMKAAGSQSHFISDRVGDELKVKTRSLDELIVARNMRRPSLVKIDVEGAEELVLRGMVAQLREQRPIVLCEIHDQPTGELARACVGILKGASYEVAAVETSKGGMGHILARPRP